MKKIVLLCLMAVSVLAAQAEAKYVFYFIGDGMGMGHVNAAQYYNRIVLGNPQPLLMQQFPVSGIVTTYSGSSPVTDSVAAGTALATGKKTKNYTVGLSPDHTRRYRSVARDLKDEGWGVAVLTSVSADDATPAAFYAHQQDRNMRYEIDCEAAESGFDFIGGGNLSGMKADNDIATRLADNGFTLLRGTGSEVPADAGKLVLLSPQDKSDIGYTIDSVEADMKLVDMTRMALAHLLKVSPDRFFMMVEGGNIDHAAHANDGGAVIKEILAFQDAIRVAYDFYLKHPDETLIIVTADHDTGGMALAGNVNLATIDSQRISKDALAHHCRGIVRQEQEVSWDEMKAFLSDKLGLWDAVPVDERQERGLKEAFDKTFIARQSNDEKGLYNSFDEFVNKVFDLFNRRTGTAFINRSHTANPVPVFAIGQGADMFAGVQDNTSIPAKVYASTRNLEGKTLCVFGDSYVRNHRRPASETWHSKAASLLGMNYVNCGINGSSILYDRSSEGFGKAMTERCKDLPDSIDCLLIIAGHNDASLIKTDDELARFDKALEELLENLKKRYPAADIGYVLPWNVDRGYFKQVLASITRICGKYGIPVFNAEEAGDIRVNDPDYRAVYFQDRGINDTAHLNAAGHGLIVREGSRFIADISK